MLKTKLLEAWASIRTNDYYYSSRFVFTYWYYDDVDPEDRCDSNPNVPWSLVTKFCRDKFINLTGHNPDVMVVSEFIQR